MTDDVLEISLRGAAAQFPAAARPAGNGDRCSGDVGTGPYRLRRAEAGGVRLRLPRGRGRGRAAGARPTSCCAASAAALAVARFADGRGRSGRSAARSATCRSRAPPDLPGDAAASSIRSAACSASPSPRSEGPLADAGGAPRRWHGDRPRRRSSPRSACPASQPRTSLVAPGVAGAARRRPSPDWAAVAAAERRERGRARDRRRSAGAPLRLRVAMPDGPGYRLVFAHLRRDWRLIGVEAERVGAGRAGRSEPDRRGRAGQSRQLVSAPFHLRRERGLRSPPPTRRCRRPGSRPTPAERQAQFADGRPDTCRARAVHPADRAGALVAGLAAADRLPAQPVRPAPGRRT